jgi:hypothetical protein
MDHHSSWDHLSGGLPLSPQPRSQKGFNFLSVEILLKSNGNQNRSTKIYSAPLFDRVDLNPHTYTISGSIHSDNSIFRQPPSAAVDAAWAQVSLEGYELINVTHADIIASNKDPSTRVRWTEAVDAYPAQVEFAHKIHCLNQVRKEIWGEHYFGDVSIHADDADQKRQAVQKTVTLQQARRIHREHTMHCLHILLQDLMCNVDVGIITHNWVKVPGEPEEKPMALADFSTVKQCRDFDAVADFVRKNAVPGGSEKLADLRGSADTVVFQTGDSYF